jgi:hypothetical protein
MHRTGLSIEPRDVIRCALSHTDIHVLGEQSRQLVGDFTAALPGLHHKQKVTTYHRLTKGSGRGLAGSTASGRSEDETA